MVTCGRAISLGLIGLAALTALAGCGGIAHLDCDSIAASARQLSQERPIRIESIAGVRETARTKTEVRCTGTATLADGGTAPLYLRARDVNGQIEIAYQGVPYP
jgi:hypothetical protein